MKKISARARRVGGRAAAIVVAACLASVAAAASAIPAAKAAATCATSGPAGNAYQVTLCITAPDAAATISGSTPVTSTISVPAAEPHGGRGFPDPGAAVLGCLHR